MKPLATLNRPMLGTVDVVTKESTVSFKERTDVTAVPAMGVVAETMTALVLASRGAAQVRRRLAGRSSAATATATSPTLGETPSASGQPRDRWLSAWCWSG